MKVKQLALFGAAALLLASTATAGPVTIADTTNDFAGTQGANGWQYGYYTNALNSSTFATSGMIYDGAWHQGVATPPYLFDFSGSLVHPNGLGHVDSSNNPIPELFNVRRWTASMDEGMVNISGSMYKSATNPGAAAVDAAILVDGVVVYSQTVAGTDGTGYNFSIPVSIKAGDTVDLYLAPTVASNDSYALTYFGTTLSAVTPAPEPGTFFAFGIGLLGISRLRRLKNNS